MEVVRVSRKFHQKINPLWIVQNGMERSKRVSVECGKLVTLEYKAECKKYKLRQSSQDNCFVATYILIGC